MAIPVRLKILNSLADTINNVSKDHVAWLWHPQNNAGDTYICIILDGSIMLYITVGDSNFYITDYNGVAYGPRQDKIILSDPNCYKRVAEIVLSRIKEREAAKRPNDC